MIQTIIENRLSIKMWLSNMDERAWKEARNLANFPFAFHHIAIMPDAHAGTGIPIGAVLAVKDVVIPNAIGEDAGCGMSALRTSIKVSGLSKEMLRKRVMREIRKAIPIGRNEHKQQQSEDYLPESKYLEKTVVCQRRIQSALKQIGTLGGGNHFLELQKDMEDNLWIMIHSGSRGLGGKVAEYYVQKAEIFAKMYNCPYPVAQQRLAYLPLGSREGEDYWNEMKYCVDFAKASRKLMMLRVQEVLKDVVPDAEFFEYYDTPHNYAAKECHFGEMVIVHRKGAAHAGVDEIGIIPGSQGTKSYIVKGLGNPDSFCSSSHGAGREMSRSQAFYNLSLEQEVKRLNEQGIIHAIRFQKDLEEAAGAYKDIHTVMENQRDLVEPLIELSPVAVIKA